MRINLFKPTATFKVFTHEIMAGLIRFFIFALNRIENCCHVAAGPFE